MQVLDHQARLHFHHILQKMDDLPTLDFFPGAQHYFGIPLVKAHQIFQHAIQKVSGLGRTVRGPSMSATPGKVQIDGVSEINGTKVIVLRMLQGRNPEWVNRPFFAKYDENAIWLDDLKPAFEDKFFFEDELNEIKDQKMKNMNS